MKVVSLSELEAMPVDMQGACGVSKQLPIGAGDGSPLYSFRVFRVAPGGNTPYHTHPFEHEVFFHSGTGEVFFEGETHPVGPGHVAFIPPDVLHQFVNTGDEPLVFVCVVPS